MSLLYKNAWIKLADLMVGEIGIDPEGFPQIYLARKGDGFICLLVQKINLSPLCFLCVLEQRFTLSTDLKH